MQENRMTIERVRTFHRAHPFQPFRIRTADGRAFDVKSPEFMSMSPSGRTVHVEFGNDDFATIDLLLVTTIENIPPAPASA